MTEETSGGAPFRPADDDGDHGASTLAVASASNGMSPDDACFRQVVEAIADSVIIHRKGRIIYANPSAERNLGGGSAMSLVGRNLFDFIAKKDHGKLAEVVDQVLMSGRPSEIVHYTSQDSDGRQRSIETISARIEMAGEVATLNVCRDVTERKLTEMALRDSEERFAVLTQHSPEAIIAVCERTIVMANEAAALLLGVAEPADLKGQDVVKFCPQCKDNLAELGFDIVQQGLAVTRQMRGRFHRFDGLAIDLDVTTIPYAHDDAPAAFLILRDITEHLRDEQRQRYLASHDPLTGLPNRLAFQHRLHTLLTEEGDAPTSRFAVHYLDLDYFKNVNDSLGHEIGDHLLQIVAARLRGAIRATDLVARLGGDEFAVLQCEAIEGDAPSHLAKKLQQAIMQPCSVGDQLLHVSTTIGIAVYPDHGDDADQLLRRADLALYHAKESGRNAVSLFSGAMDVRLRERDLLINQLIRAEAAGEFEVYFQPIASLHSGQIEAVEALLRWNHPERGMMTADEFIHAIEGSREGQRIGTWVLEEACHHAKTWEKAGIDGLRVAVNLSMSILQRPDFTDLVKDALHITDLDPSKLELELTERIIISAGAVGIAPKLQELRDLGVHIALDDFGTGYSSLALLRDLPVDRIKIDRSFVQGFGIKLDDTAIVRAITNLGCSLNKRVTAEGVECSEIEDRLRAEGCHDIQGYHLARPMPASSLVDFLKEARR